MSFWQVAITAHFCAAAVSLVILGVAALSAHVNRRRR